MNGGGVASIFTRPHDTVLCKRMKFYRHSRVCKSRRKIKFASRPFPRRPFRTSESNPNGGRSQIQYGVAGGAYGGVYLGGIINIIGLEGDAHSRWATYIYLKLKIYIKNNGFSKNVKKNRFKITESAIVADTIFLNFI